MQSELQSTDSGPFGNFLAATFYLQQATADELRGRVKVAAAKVAEVALGACGPEDLSGTIDEAFESEGFYAYFKAVAEWRSFAKLSDLHPSPTVGVMRERERVFGPDIARRLTLVDKIWLEAARVAAPGVGTLDPSRATGAAPLDTINSTSIPLEIRTLALTAWHGQIASLTIHHLMDRGSSHALIGPLVTVAYRGARAALRVLRGEFSDLSAHERRESWVVKTFASAAEGDGYFSPHSAE